MKTRQIDHRARMMVGELRNAFATTFDIVADKRLSLNLLDRDEYTFEEYNTRRAFFVMQGIKLAAVEAHVYMHFLLNPKKDKIKTLVEQSERTCSAMDIKVSLAFEKYNSAVRDSASLVEEEIETPDHAITYVSDMLEDELVRTILNIYGHEEKEDYQIGTTPCEMAAIEHIHISPS